MVRPSNPRLTAAVVEAVMRLCDGKGSSVRDVLRYIRRSSNAPTRNLTMQVRRALERAVTDGLLRLKSGRYKALIARRSTPEKRKLAKDSSASAPADRTINKDDFSDNETPAPDECRGPTRRGRRGRGRKGLRHGRRRSRRARSGKRRRSRRRRSRRRSPRRSRRRGRRRNARMGRSRSFRRRPRMSRYRYVDDALPPSMRLFRKRLPEDDGDVPSSISQRRGRWKRSRPNPFSDIPESRYSRKLKSWRCLVCHGKLPPERSASRDRRRPQRQRQREQEQRQLQQQLQLHPEEHQPAEQEEARRMRYEENRADIQQGETTVEPDAKGSCDNVQNGSSL